MAIDFGDGNTSRYYRITTDDDLLRLPAGDWCIGIWYRASDNSGTAFQYLVSSGTLSSNNSFHLFWTEASNVSTPNTWRFVVEDFAGADPTSSGGNTISSVITADGTDRLIVCQRNGSLLELWITPASGTAVREANCSVGSLAQVNLNDIYIGQRPDLTTTRAFEEEAGGFFLARGALSQSEIVPIADGTGDPRTYVDVVVYLDMRSAKATLLDIQGAGHATRNGTSWPSDVTEFPGVSGIFTFYDAHAFTSPTQIDSDGAATWFSDPTTIRYESGAVDKTWVGYCDGSRNILIAEIDHNNSNSITSTTLTTISTPTSKDDHFVPSILVRASDSKLMAFWGNFWTGTISYRVSSSAEDGTAFASATTISTVSNASYYTYPFQVSSGRIYVFYRGNDSVTPNRGLNYVYTDDDGGTWSSPVLITDQVGAGTYFKIDQHEDDLYIAISRTPGSVNDDIRDVRVFVFNDQKLYDLDGTEIFDTGDYPLTITNLPAAYDSAVTGVDAWIFDVAAHEGNPEILFYTYPSAGRKHGHWGRWNGSAWDIVELTGYNETLDSNVASGKAEPYYAPGGCLDRARPGKLMMVQGGKSLSGFTRFVTADQGTTWTRWPMTDMSADKIRPRIPINHTVGSHDDFDVIYVQGTYEEFENWTTSLQALPRAANDPVIESDEIDLVVADALHSHVVDNATLAQEHQLTVSDSAHAHAADSVTLTQVHQLAAADGAHAHAVDNVTLTAEGDLEVAEALHAHTADNVVLTQQHSLAVADASHAHSADNVVLSEETDLAVADAAHAHVADSVTLAQQHQLIVADATHGHVADNATLTEGAVFAIDEALHAHVADNVVLEQQHVLALAGTLHAHSADNVTLFSSGGLLLTVIVSDAAVNDCAVSEAAVA